ncbi:YceI family protein [Gordonia phthalatica]|uniref:S-adenosyl-L-methionine-dependent methyltransferase n=1 Tax=Gordonia phthalatica TaxID=1136941 RepID=A0A0N9NG56_9ACTN|nr:YceI family protein [Gordonia phthalatica]ALG86653.1 S-adenosyl-L-methionine-dependent methyltransferase [Gordonia phthalatica]
MSRQVELGPDHGALTIRTGVTGKAARTGHRLVIGFDRWAAAISYTDDAPSAVRVAVDVESLQVLSGEGGLTPMTAPERGVARLNALKSLKASKFGEITFTADDVTAADGGYRLVGTLTICGMSRPHTVEVTSDGATVSGESPVRQTDFGVKPYSLMMGALKVADEVVVAVEATISR